jgi:hypothetical protein
MHSSVSQNLCQSGQALPPRAGEADAVHPALLRDGVVQETRSGGGFDIRAERERRHCTLIQAATIGLQ